MSRLETSIVDYCVFIQANDKQMIGAILAEHAVRRYSKHNDKFDVRIMNYDDFPFMHAREGEEFLRAGGKRVWVRDDLQSFTPSRFLPPQLMGYKGRALVIDPDVFALGDVWELLSRDMAGKAIMCRQKTGRKGKRGCLATSVMLLDCEKLTHWKVEEQFNAMFEGTRDYMKWVCLQYEDTATIGFFETEWNDFDHLTEKTKMLHTTKRKHQPWKTGLKIDYRPADSFQFFPPRHWWDPIRRKLFGDYGLLGSYKQHPDPKQEQFFFGLLKECVETGVISEEQVRDEMAKNHVRHDALEVLEKTPSLPAA